MITYGHPPQVELGWVHGRPLLSLPEDGKVVIDQKLLALWQAADGKSLDDLLEKSPFMAAAPDVLRAALTCLAEAGLLLRVDGASDNKYMDSQEAESPLDIQGYKENVSAILVSYNSQAWLDDCLRSLLAQSIPPSEIILVDNGSEQDPTAWAVKHYPSVRVLRLEGSHSLAYALNRGIQRARGDYLLLLNPDVTFAPGALAAMLHTAQAHPGCAAVAPKLRFSWAPAFLNGLGNHAPAFSWGSDNGLGHLDLGQFDHWTELPSACFAAALLNRKAWEQAGPLDEGFPMYYEDIEWCYRARLMGWKVLAAPSSVVYHALGQRWHTGEQATPDPVKVRHVTYGRLRFALRLFRRKALAQALAGYALADLMLILRGMLRLRLKQPGAVLNGWGSMLGHLPALLRDRGRLQARQMIPDAQLLSQQRAIPSPRIWRGLPELTWDDILHIYVPLIKSRRSKPVPEFPTSTPRLLIISHDIVDEKMAGPGMRYLEMAHTLSADMPVTLAIPNQTSLSIPGVELTTYSFEQPANLRILTQDCSVILLSSFILDKFPWLAELSVRRVIDLYDPLVLENLHLYQTESMELQRSQNTQVIQSMNRLVKTGDFFLCGNERQRDFWLGVLAANGRINPLTFNQDHSLRALIDVVGMGFPDHSPHLGTGLRGILPAVPSEAQIVLWGGGMWDWLDPLTLIKAWPAVLARHPNARLVFLGSRHPNPLVPRHAMAENAEALASKLGEKDRSIIFIEWLSYTEREALLCEAAVGVSLHPLHLETHFSIRSRVLDYLWAKLPVLVTEGDVTSEWVAEYGLGQVVPPHDEAAVAQALDVLLSQPKSTWETAFTPLHARYTWPLVVAPLRRYCLEGDPAPDQKTNTTSPTSTDSAVSWRDLLARANYIRRQQGCSGLLRRLRRYIQWRLSRF